MRSTDHTRVLDEREVAAILRRTRMGYHRAVAALVSVGNDVIMDYPLSERWRLGDLLDVLSGYDVTAVDVHCDPESWTGGREPEATVRSAWLAPSVCSSTTTETSSSTRRA